MAEDVAFHILGRPFHARGISPSLRAWLDEHWHRPDHDLPPHPFAITLFGEAAAVAEPVRSAGRIVIATMPGYEQFWRHHGSTWSWCDDGVAVRLELEPDGARIYVSGDVVASANAIAALHVALCEALRASGPVPLHAALAVPPGVRGRATALFGRSGAGKSTTLLRLWRAGWTPLAEDLSWVDPETLAVYPWDLGVRLWPGTLEAFLPDLAEKGWRAGSDGKLFLAYGDLGVDTARVATLAWFARLERDSDEDARWEPLAAVEAVRALWEAVGVQLAPAIRVKTSAWIASMTKRIPGLRLRIGPAALPDLPADEFVGRPAGNGG